MAGNHRKIQPFSRQRLLHINLGMIIFGCIFVYILVCVVMYFTSSHVVGYEVKTGSLSVNNIYTGIALRRETVFTCSGASGYVNYYAREGGRVAVGDLVYTVDETGRFSDSAANTDPDADSLSDQDLSELKSEIIGFSSVFDPHNFRSVYDFKYSVQGTVMKLANKNILGDIDAAGKENVAFARAVQTGIVVYSVDGYEEMKPEQITAESYDLSRYNKRPLVSGTILNPGDPAYKLSLSEEWSILIPVTPQRGEELREAEYVKVKFLKNQDTSWAQVILHENADGVYAELKFNNSMISFCTDRFIDIELILEDEIGLKIPNSAIVEKEFFLIDEDYVTKGGPGGEEGVLRETYTEDGQAGVEFVETTIYNYDEENRLYYVDDSRLRIGDYIVKPNSTEKEAVSKRGKLIGVYNINKGYAEFRQVHILEKNNLVYQNEEYSLAQPNTMYGLSVYDYIALDASSVEEDELTSSNEVEKKFSIGSGRPGPEENGKETEGP